jgi:bifunctional DNA-binding transcriptional regulator/antitoxin component of YhaV-PrlF toxin-antitoxin module
LSVVTVDERGRLTIPKELGIRGQRAIIIPAGSFFITIPLPDDPLAASKDWIRTSKTKKELSESAEKLAQEDATTRSWRRKLAC